MAEIKLIGIDQAIAKLTSLGAKIERKVIGKAVSAAGKPFTKQLRLEVPVGNRLLKRSITSKVKRYPAYILALVGQDKRKQFKSARIKRRGGISGRGQAVPIHLVEQKTRPHEIRPKHARALAFDATGRELVRPGVRHPGTPANDFTRRAARKAEPEAKRAFEEKLRTETLAEASKV